MQPAISQALSEQHFNPLDRPHISGGRPLRGAPEYPFGAILNTISKTAEAQTASQPIQDQPLPQQSAAEDDADQPAENTSPAMREGAQEPDDKAQPLPQQEPQAPAAEAETIQAGGEQSEVYMPLNDEQKIALQALTVSVDAPATASGVEQGSTQPVNDESNSEAIAKDVKAAESGVVKAGEIIDGNGSIRPVQEEFLVTHAQPAQKQSKDSPAPPVQPQERSQPDPGRRRTETAIAPEQRTAVEPPPRRADESQLRQAAEPRLQAPAIAHQTGAGASQEDTAEHRERQSSQKGQAIPKGASDLPPASARAEQVDETIRLERATGRPPTGEPVRVQTSASTSQPPSVPVESALRTAPAGDVQLGSTQPTPALGSAASASFDAARAEESPITSRIMRGLTAMVNQRGGSLTMRLDPPELGTMRVQMTLSRGTVTAQIIASTVQAHGLLERNIAMLRTALESHGLSVERLSVQLSSPAQSSMLNQHQQHSDWSNRSAQQDAHADAGEGQSRGRREHEHGFGQDQDPERETHRNAFARFADVEAAALEGAGTQ